MTSIVPTPTVSPFLVEMVGGEADPWFAGIAGSLATLIAGALIGFLSSFATERIRAGRDDKLRKETQIREDKLRAEAYEREDDRRFDDTLRLAVAEFMAAGQGLQTLGLKLTVYDTGKREEETNALKKQALEEFPQMWALRYAIDLVASEDIQLAALHYAEAVQNATTAYKEDDKVASKANTAARDLSDLVRKKLSGKPGEYRKSTHQEGAPASEPDKS
ncbi:hypothetical protein [Rathayibacter festucae]|uniref:hypothetical protein n=1 Tax=Rathayibacter festucae TaxID=110937 RepID=UPI000FDACC25|nr:hypothetical protein [Rathayibacter festucae]